MDTFVASHQLDAATTEAALSLTGNQPDRFAWLQFGRQLLNAAGIEGIAVIGVIAEIAEIAKIAEAALCVNSFAAAN